MGNLTEHFGIEELTRSEYALRNGLDNTPDPEVIANLFALCNNVLEPLRTILGVPIHINSGYRSPVVNRGIGGAATSQHQDGLAADLIVPGKQNIRVVRTLHIEGIPYDQLIYEFGEEGWVHVSWTFDERRHQILRAFAGPTGKTMYEPFDPWKPV